MDNSEENTDKPLGENEEENISESELEQASQEIQIGDNLGEISHDGEIEDSELGQDDVTEENQNAENVGEINQDGEDLGLEHDDVTEAVDEILGDDLVLELENLEISDEIEGNSNNISESNDVSDDEKNYSENEIDETEHGDESERTFENSCPEFLSSECPNYVIKEYTATSYYNLRFDIGNTRAAFKISLPTLKDFEKPQIYEGKIRPRDKTPIRKALKKARARTNEYEATLRAKNISKRTLASTFNHIIRIDRARRMESRLHSKIRGVKMLPEPPEKCLPWKNKKRPTEFPPEELTYQGPPRIRKAITHYNDRSDQQWFMSKRKKSGSRLKKSSTGTGFTSTPPQEHDPWAGTQESHGLKSNINKKCPVRFRINKKNKVRAERAKSLLKIGDNKN